MEMLSDNNPSMIFGLYSKPEKKQELFQELKKLGVGVRELSFIDVEIPLERKDEVVNWFKHFIKCDYWAWRSPFQRQLKFMGFDIGKILFDKMGYSQVKWKLGDWKNDNKHKLLWTLAFPVAVQDNSAKTTSPEELKAIEELKTFTSHNYKPIIEGVVNPEDMKIIKNDS